MRRNRLVGLLVLVAAMLVIAAAISAVRRGFSARDQPSALESYVARTARKLAVPSKAMREKNPFPPSPELVTEARAHFADHCAICHANNGSGNTEIGRNLYPKAPDMRLPQTQNLTDGELYYTIHNGIRLTGMPAWGTEEKDDASWKLVHFIRHLPQLTPAEEREMEALNPKGPGEKQEEMQEEQFLNQGPPRNQAPKASTHQNH
ncbi:MAG: c-type cytochrome [Acidobacteria bacterium]|jgi:mono/diheme cytochrome c family protein|nr:c-type cytochrome [Acidobacteriota bacterium]